MILMIISRIEYEMEYYEMKIYVKSISIITFNKNKHELP